MAENDFKQGDVVILKSGGPSMTIDSFVYNQVKGTYYTDRVVCIWFDEDSKLQRENFQTVSLEKDE